MRTLRYNLLSTLVQTSTNIRLEFAENKLSFEPSKGAAITRLTLASNPAVTAIKPQASYQFESSLLFPFPNRLSNGSFDFEGKTYKFPQNDFKSPNALHGMVHDQSFTVIDQGLDASKAWVTSQLIDHGKNESFPFPFKLDVTYILTDKALTVELKVTNQGSGNMPFGIGWHPYFNLPYGVNEGALKLPECREVEVNDTLLPTGRKLPSTCFDSLRPLSGVTLDTCFEANKKEENSTFIKLNGEQTLEVWQDAHYPFIQVFTPKDGQSIAVEPMTCGIDALNTGDGLQILQPEASFTAVCGVRLA